MAKLNHLSSSAFDHSPLILQLCAKPRKKRIGRVFRFESMWLKDPRCKSIVEEAWDEGLYGGSGDVLNRCLESCRARLETERLHKAEIEFFRGPLPVESQILEAIQV
nr:hypothetical protein CFP56_34542 [Quercus suber]